MRVKLLILSILVAILLSSGAYSFGIAFEYMDNNTLFLYPGQTYMFKLVVQNTKDESERVRVSLDSSIATLVGGPELDVPGKSYDTHLFFNITIPEQAQLGDLYNINYLVSPVGSGEGQIPVSVNYDRVFKVKVVKKPEGAEEQQPLELSEKQKIPGWALIIGLIIIITVLALLIWKKSHQVSSKILKTKPHAKATEPSQTTITPPKLKTQPTMQPRADAGVIKKVEEHPRAFEEKPAEYETEYEKTPVKTPIPKEPVISQHDLFHLKDGRKLRDLEDLYHVLENMNHDTFNHHVNSTKNDFATWTAHTFGRQELANRLFKISSKQEMLELMKNELEKK